MSGPAKGGSKDWRAIAPAVAAVAGADVVVGEPLARHTSLRLGGPVDLFVRVTDEASACAVLAVLEAEGCPWLALGSGTNVLVTDGGVEGAVLTPTGGLARLDVSGSLMTAGAGAQVVPMLRDLASRGLGGLSYLTGIPGTVGGAVAMNAGTLYGYVDRSLDAVCLCTSRGSQWVGAGNLGLGYRLSALPAGALVAAARVSVLPRTAADDEVETALTERRQKAHPPAAGTAGSFFKNPDIAAGLFAGELIEKAGLKGERRGAAFVSPVHANFLTNGGGTSATDLLALAEHVRATVLARTGVALTPEVKLVGRGSDDWRQRLGMPGE